MIRKTLSVVTILVFIVATPSANAGLNVTDHFTVTEVNGADNWVFPYGSNSLVGSGGEATSITGLAPAIIGTGASQMAVISGTGSLSAPNGWAGGGFSIFRYVKVEMTSDFDVEYNVTVTENNAPSQFNGLSWAGVAFTGVNTQYDIDADSSGSFSHSFGSTSPDFSGTASSPSVAEFEVAANSGSVFGAGPTPFDAALDLELAFELKFTPTSFVDDDGDGINDNFGSAFAVPEPNAFLLLMMAGVLIKSGRYFQRVSKS